MNASSMLDRSVPRALALALVLGVGVGVGVGAVQGTSLPSSF